MKRIFICTVGGGLVGTAIAVFTVSFVADTLNLAGATRFLFALSWGAALAFLFIVLAQRAIKESI